MANLWARLALLAVVLALASASRPQWQRPNAASVIRWNGCAANDETFSILSIQDGSNPRSTFTHSANVNPVWQIFACDVAVPGALVMKFGREIVVGASAVTRPNSVRLNINSDGVEDLEFNRAGEWVSLTGLTSPKNSFTPMTNTITATLTRNNIVSPLASAFTLGNPFAAANDNVAKHCRNGPKVVKSTSGVYATLFTARGTVATGAVAFLCNYDTDATATAICANGIYRSVTLVSATSTSFTTCTPEANDFEFANGQFVVSTNCGINLCGADFTTCVAGTRGGWNCEGGAVAGAFPTIPLQMVNPIGISNPTPAVNAFLAVVTLGYTHTFAGNNYGFLHIHSTGYIVLTPTAAVPAGIPVGAYPAGYAQVAANAYYPIFHSANLDTSIAGASIVYQTNTGTQSFTVQFRQVGIVGSTSVRVTAEAVFTTAGGVAVTRYFYTGDAPAATVFQSAAGVGAPLPFGCDAGTFNSAILPFQTTAFSVFGFDAAQNYRFLQYSPTGFTSVYSPINPVPVLESNLYLNARCCKAANVRIAAAQSGTNGFVAYVARRTGGAVIDIMVRFVTQGANNWGPSGAASVSLSTGSDGFVGISQGAEENVLIRGIAATYVPTTVAGVNVPFIVISKQSRSCRRVGGANAPRVPGTFCGLAFEYLIAVCSTPTCTGTVSWRIVAESSLLTSGNLAERYVAGAATPQNADPRPMPDLLSLSISPKTNLPVLALGSTGGLPTLFECLDFKCDAAQVTVGDDYLAGHFGEGFVVAGQSQLTLVSQAAWGIASESKPYAQRWTSFTTSPDGQIMCNPTNVGKSFTVAGRVYLCTRLPRTPFSAYIAGELSATTPISSALFTWAEVGGRLRLHVTENSA